MAVDGKKSYTYYTYANSTSVESRGAVKEAVEDIKNKSNKNLNFFSNLHIFVSDKIKNYPSKSNLNDYIKQYSLKDWQQAGFTVQPIFNKNAKEIAILTQKHVFMGLIPYGEEKPSDLKGITVHELGHLFDCYFKEDIDIQLKDQIKKISNKFPEDLTTSEKEIRQKWLSQSEL
ncbi:MAG: hypothetical protein MJ231_00560, partial [bacterium]|nr:hypothetical protein [bacterium]